MKVLELKGYKSLRAMNAFHTLILGLKMLPSYAMESYEEFYSKVDLMPDSDQEKLIREAIVFVNLSQEEVEALLSFATDKNGVAYSAVNIKNLGPQDIMEAIVPVCLAIAKINVSLVTEDEKKNLKTSQSTSEEPSPETQISH